MFVMYKKIILAESVYGLYAITTLLSYPILIVISFAHYIRKCFKNVTCNKNFIQGDVALITGSGRGLGRCLAIALAERGCHIAVADIQGKLAEETADFIGQTYGVKAKAYKIDVTNFQQLEDLKEKITKDLGDVTILINNAAILMLSSAANPPPEEVQRMIDVNFTSMVYTTQIFLPKMKQLNRGYIVNISSMAALIPTPLFNVYSATKAAVRNLTASLRIEFMQQNCQIQATTVMPTYINTNQRTNQLMKIIDEKERIMCMEGEVVAQYIIKAMMSGDDEVTIPRSFICMYKLLGILPIFVVEKLSALGTQYNWKKVDSQELRNILKSSDIQTDM